ncbi:MAG: transcription elongation factor GreA [Actinomycetota bacterium]
MNEDIEISPDTLVRLQAELEDLTTDGRDKMAERLQRARELGDLKENAEYHAAKDSQGMMEARIRQLQHTLKNAVVRDVPTDLANVAPGLIVTIKDGDDEDDYLFANSNEEKLAGFRTVTPSSPLGKALVGKKIGDVAEVAAPSGRFSVTVTAIRPRP